MAWVFGGEHGISQVLSLNYEQLAAEGYLTGADPDSDGMPCWEDGCLFTIAEQEAENNGCGGTGGTVTFDAQKWRSRWGRISSRTAPPPGMRRVIGGTMP